MGTRLEIKSPKNSNIQTSMGFSLSQLYKKLDPSFNRRIGPYIAAALEMPSPLGSSSEQIHRMISKGRGQASKGSHGDEIRAVSC
ncbi:hypothetical protein CDAR_36331 [Caerostris darwini]|uniref:Uncharacterized protein n=1 Tax=Caerostris darwini TaxID=1538125 RepID=A0AAV4R9D2_9ARAC|nr:hypothetical protein CDAR_36331 [Caerostris darwini]